MCGECDWPLETQLTEEEVYQLHQIAPGGTFNFRGKDYLFVERLPKTLEWVLYSPDATFVIKEKR